MANIKKLEIICLKTVIDLGLVIDSEGIPAPLLKRIKEMRAINGRFISQDNLDSISAIEVNYDGEIIELSFIIYRQLHKVFLNQQISSPINKAILFFVEPSGEALMDVDIVSKEDITSIELSCKNSGWQWNLSLEIRYILLQG